MAMLAWVCQVRQGTVRQKCPSPQKAAWVMTLVRANG